MDLHPCPRSRQSSAHTVARPLGRHSQTTARTALRLAPGRRSQTSTHAALCAARPAPAPASPAGGPGEDGRKEHKGHKSRQAEVPAGTAARREQTERARGRTKETWRQQQEEAQSPLFFFPRPPLRCAAASALSLPGAPSPACLPLPAARGYMPHRGARPATEALKLEENLHERDSTCLNQTKRPLLERCYTPHACPAAPRPRVTMR